MDYQKKFETVAKRFLNADAVAPSELVAVQITLTDEDCGGVFYVACRGGVCEVAPYDYVDNTAALTIKARDLTMLLNGKLDVEKAAESGRIAYTGNVEHIKLLSVLGAEPEKPAKAEKKPAAKKAASKKTAAKKSEKKA